MADYPRGETSNPRSMSPESELSSAVDSPLLGSSRPAGRSSLEVLTWKRSAFSPEILFAPVAFATTLAATLPSTTFIDIQRQAICEIWKITHNDPTTLPVGSLGDPDLCDAPEVARYFASFVAIVGTIEGIIAMALFGILSGLLSHRRRKPVLLVLLVIRMMGSCLIPVTQYAPSWLSRWVFITGMLFELFAGLVPYAYLFNLYIVDVCDLEDRTAALSKIAGYSALGTCLSLAFGGLITTKTGNPFIVFEISTVIFLATITYVISILPESFPEDKANKHSQPHPGHSVKDTPKLLLASIFQIFAPLRTFIPTHNWRLTWCGLHAFVFSSANAYSFSAWLILATSRYHLTPADTGIFLTSLSISGAIVLMLIVPLLIRLLRSHYTRTIIYPIREEEDIDDSQEVEPEVSNRLEVHLTFLSCVAAGVFTLGAAASTSNGILVFFAICLGFSTIHDPTLRSIVAGSVDPLKQGEALAAIEMISKGGAVLSSIIMGSILTQTINTRPLLVFFVNLIVVLISGGLLFFVKDADRYRAPLDTI